MDPQLAGFLQFIEDAGYPPVSEGTPEAARKGFVAMSAGTVRPDQVVQVGSVEDLTVPGAAGDRPARLYRPATDGPHPTVVYLHGGGFVLGDLETHDQTCRRLCLDADVVVLAVDYRLAPEHPFPAGVEDAIAATRWAADQGLGGDSRLAIAGDSAGGNFAAVVAQTVPELLTAQLLIYPTVDAFGDYPSRHQNESGYGLEVADMLWFHENYTGGADVSPDDPRFSPLRAESLAGQPPAVVGGRGVRPAPRRGRCLRRPARCRRRPRRPGVVRRDDPRLRRHGSVEHRGRGRRRRPERQVRQAPARHLTREEPHG